MKTNWSRILSVCFYHSQNMHLNNSKVNQNKNCSDSFAIKFNCKRIVLPGRGTCFGSSWLSSSSSLSHRDNCLMNSCLAMTASLSPLKKSSFSLVHYVYKMAIFLIPVIVPEFIIETKLKLRVCLKNSNNRVSNTISTLLEKEVRE